MKDVVVYSAQKPSINDVMALVHKLSYLDLLGFSTLISGDVDKIADAAKIWDDNEEQEAQRKREAALVGHPAPYPAAPPFTQGFGGAKS